MKGLKIILWICAISCLLGFVFAALPWRATAALFHLFGVPPPTAEPIIVYLYRLCLAMFGMIGIFFTILARNPLKYGAMLLLAAYGLLCYGVFCLVGGYDMDFQSGHITAMLSLVSWLVYSYLFFEKKPCKIN